MGRQQRGSSACFVIAYYLHRLFHNQRRSSSSRAKKISIRDYRHTEVPVDRYCDGVMELISLSTRAKVVSACCIAKYLQLKELDDERNGGSGQSLTMAQIEGARAGQCFLADHAPCLQPRAGRIHRLVHGGACGQPGLRTASRVALEARKLGPISNNVRITAVRKLAVEAAHNACRRRN